MTQITMLGCGGFIGSHLLERLLPRQDVRIHGWDPETSKIDCFSEHPRLTIHRESTSSLRVQEELEACIAASDLVINLAAICNPAEYNTRPLDVIRANLFDVYRVVEMCAKHRTWLMSFSTSEVYGRTLSSYVDSGLYDSKELYELDEDTTPLIMGPIANQRWTYACAKQMLERLVYAHHTDSGMPFTIIRPLNFFGPRMDYIPGRDGDGVPRVLACFMAALFNRTPMMLVDGGRALRTIISIYDAIDAIELMIDRPSKSQNQIFNIGNRHNEVSMAELGDRMRKIYAELTGDPSYLHHPMQVLSGEEFYGPGYEDCDRRMPRLDKAERLLGWRPVTPLDAVLRSTIKYYHEHYVGSARAAS